jgi:hypothetical protein
VQNADTLIVSFAGHDRAFGGLPRFTFVNFLETNFQQASKHFYTDKYLNLYHNGIFGLTKTVEETAAYLAKDIEQGGYKKVIFLGVSSGGYAAVLFGSLVGATDVLAFMPQTLRRNSKHVDEQFRDLSDYINPTTQYYLYGDLSVTDPTHHHHISHCERIAENRTNVNVINKQKINLREMRDSGELVSVLQNIIHLFTF